MSTYVITGAGRGIGFEMLRQLIAEPSSKTKTLVAITRNKDSKRLNDLIAQSNDRIVNVIIPDITDENSIAQALPLMEEALPEGLDVLINVAGIAGQPVDSVSKAPVDDLMSVLKTNVGSIQAMSSALIPLLKKGTRKTVLNITSGLGSITNTPRFTHLPTPSYKTSKAAVNMLTRQYALEYGKQGFTFFLISPGWLKTDMSGEAADLTVSDGVKAVLERLAQADTSYNDKFFNIKVNHFKKNGKIKYDGAEIDW